MVKLVTFGETMVQYNANYVGQYREGGEYLEDCAGAESNVAVDLSRLGLPGVETSWISRLGDDSPGDLILTELTGRIRVFASKYVGQRTGISYLNHYEDGKHVKTYDRKDSAASRLVFEDVSPHLEESDIAGGITMPREHHQRLVKESLGFICEPLFHRIETGQIAGLIVGGKLLLEVLQGFLFGLGTAGFILNLHHGEQSTRFLVRGIQLPSSTQVGPGRPPGLLA